MFVCFFTGKVNETKPSKQTNNVFFKPGLIMLKIEVYEFSDTFIFFLFDERSEYGALDQGSDF
jgi:hypothetical protein